MSGRQDVRFDEKRKDGGRTRDGFHVCINETGKGEVLPWESVLVRFFAPAHQHTTPFGTNGEMVLYLLARDIGLGLEVDLELDLDFIGLPGHGGATKVYRIYGVGRSWKFFV